MKQRIARTFLVALLALGGAAGVACDAEDERDIQEGVNDVQKGVEEVGEEAEDAVDEADSDGKDD